MLEQKPNKRRPSRGQKYEDCANPAPLLVLPFNALDNGTRPIQSQTSYLSQALQISVDGIPYTGGPLPRDRSTTISVKVANWGDKDTSALITLWWTYPTAMFTSASLDPSGLSDPIWVDVPRKDGSGRPGLATSADFDFTPPPSILVDHVCLIAEITAGDASAPGPVDPVNNRHYAQHNVDLVHVSNGKTGSFIFNAANPFEVQARVTMRLRPVRGAALQTLECIYHAEPVEISADALGLQMVAAEEGDRQCRELVFDLSGREQRLCQGLVTVKDLQPGQVSAGEVELTVKVLRGKSKEERRGSFGVIIFPIG
jgi:hypothetical protein